MLLPSSSSERKKFWQAVKRLKNNPESHPHPYPQNTYTFRKAKAIIANFKDYHPTVQDKVSVREGSEHDVDRLKTTFESMGCIDVEDPWDTAEKLNGFLENLQKVADGGFEHYDCFILVVMAHGAEGGKILDLNNKEILIEDIWGLFTADKCRYLAGKPKFFFFQACRGGKLGKGVVHADDESSTKSPMKNIREPEFISIPTQADMLMVYSTFEGFASIRNPLTGSYFIQDLCEVLSEDHKKNEESREQILSLMTYVCDRLASRSFEWILDPKTKEMILDYATDKCDESKLVKQMPTVLSTLRKIFYFRNSPK